MARVQRTVRQDDLAQREAEWQAEGLRPISFSAYRQGGVWFVRVEFATDPDA